MKSTKTKRERKRKMANSETLHLITTKVKRDKKPPNSIEPT